MANQLRSKKTGKTVRHDKEIQNPLMGLVRCAVCGRIMQRRNYRSGHIDGLICPRPHCQNVGSHLYLVEKRIIDELKNILNDFNSIVEKSDDTISSENKTENSELKIINSEIDKLQKQLNKAYDLLEQEIYDNTTFLERSSVLKEKIKQLKNEQKKYQLSSFKTKKEQLKNVIPNIQSVINNYNKNLSPKEKNELLSKIIDHVDYLKYKKGKGHEDEFSLKITIKIY